MLGILYNLKRLLLYRPLLSKNFIVSLYSEIKTRTSFLLHFIIASYRDSLAPDSCSLESNTEDLKKRC